MDFITHFLSVYTFPVYLHVSPFRVFSEFDEEDRINTALTVT